MKKAKKTIEQKAASAILERSVATVEIGGQTYEVAPPTIATLILASEIISTLPAAEPVPADAPDKDVRIFNSVIHGARGYKALGDLAAVLVLGAKGLEREEVRERRAGILGRLFGRGRYETRTVDMKARLAKAILEEMGPQELFDLLFRRINAMEIGSFFAITTSLSEANILRPTKEVED